MHKSFVKLHKFCCFFINLPIMQRCVSFTCLFIQQNGILHNKVYNVQGMAIFVTYGLMKAAFRKFLQKEVKNPKINMRLAITETCCLITISKKGKIVSDGSTHFECQYQVVLTLEGSGSVKSTPRCVASHKHLRTSQRLCSSMAASNSRRTSWEVEQSGSTNFLSSYLALM